ncbi:hypothetical protein BV22DRAFT_1047376 [Leucogyrophana mollusca]|uniref:Uncharacterized protein n=1 Tax=Leucogyrophana mollusca TaxID=85980 RepID=A0ACB8BH41_9AGAM|nr:hypothetical protein BV22DRAFT_1047376 [Leucogyrophana mollusca]
MPSIVSPSPRLAAAPCLSNTLQSPTPSTRFQLMQSPFPADAEAPLGLASRGPVSPPRLLSPIILNDPAHFALKSKSPPPCGTASRRRNPNRVARSTRRRRHPSRLDCPFDSYGHASAFDQLTWISALDSPPNFSPYDVADLSQILVDEDRPLPLNATPASGPVRRRKTSLRSNPLSSGADSLSESLPSRQLFPSYHSPDRVAICPRTPSPLISFDPRCVKFHNLMPVFP